MALTQTKIKVTKLSKQEQDEVSDILFELASGGHEVTRPVCRSECANVPRPCPFVSCKYNTYLDAEGDVLRLNHSEIEVWEMDPESSCVLDLVNNNSQGMTTKDIGTVVGLHHETVRLLLVASLKFLGDVSEISSDSSCYSKIRGV